MRTETELILKSRRVVPGRLLDAGLPVPISPLGRGRARAVCARPLTGSRSAPHSPDVTDGEAARGTSTEVRLDPERPLAAGAAALQPGRFLALYELGRLLMQQRDPAQVLRTVHEQILLQLQPDESCLLAAEGGALRPLAAYGLDLAGPEAEWPVSGTVIRQVRAEGVALLAADVQQDPRTREAESLQRFRIRSVICVPLGKPARGVAYAANRGDRPFTAEDLEFLTAVSLYASLVLESAYEIRAHRGRARPQRRAGGRAAERAAASPDRRRGTGAAEGVRHAAAPREGGSPGAAARRDRHRQGAVRPRLRGRERAARVHAGDDPLARAHARRVGALRPREGLVHGGARRPQGPARGRARRRALPGRGRRHRAGAADEAAALPGLGRAVPRRRQPGAPRGRARSSPPPTGRSRRTSRTAASAATCWPGSAT